MLLVNLFAGPGSGKSTGAAYVFSKLKMAGINTEIIPEFVKDKVWERAEKAVQNQAYVFGKQYFRTSRLEGEVDVAITDSPLLLSNIYCNDDRLGIPFIETVKSVALSYQQLNYFVKRVKKYNPKGRLQTEQESDEISQKIIGMLNSYNIEFKTVEGNQSGYDQIVADILSLKITDSLKGEHSNG